MDERRLKVQGAWDAALQAQRLTRLQSLERTTRIPPWRWALIASIPALIFTLGGCAFFSGDHAAARTLLLIGLLPGILGIAAHLARREAAYRRLRSEFPQTQRR